MENLRNVIVKLEGKTFIGRGIMGNSLLKQGNPIVLVLP